MGTYDSNISSLFSSLDNGNSSGSFDFASYAAIKNGSYGKLVKAYYSGNTTKADQVSSSTAKSDTAKAKAKQDVDTTGLNQMKTAADKLKTSAEAFNKDDLWKKTDGKEDMTAIANTVKDFADNYNKVIDQASKVSSKQISQDTAFMTSLTDTFSKILSKIGISVDAGGKMSVDEESLKKADVATIKSVFNGTATYGSQIADKAGTISRDTELGSGIYGNDASVSSAIASIYNQFI